MEKKVDAIIVGGGPAGIAAAIWCKRLGLSHVLLEEREKLGGQLRFIHNPIIDYPGIPELTGAELKERLTRHAESVGCEVMTGVAVIAIDAAGRRVAYRNADGTDGSVQGASLVLAMGARDRRLGVAGEDGMIARGEVYSASRDRERFAGRPVAIVGGGDRAFEGALLLADHGADVALIHRSEKFRARPEFVGPALRHARIRLYAPARVEAIVGERCVSALDLCHGEERSLVRIPAEAVFVRIGVEPASHLVRGQVATDAAGMIGTDRQRQTDVPLVYAIGDVATAPPFSSISSSIGQGMVAAKAIYQQLQGK